MLQNFSVCVIWFENLLFRCSVSVDSVISPSLQLCRYSTCCVMTLHYRSVCAGHLCPAGSYHRLKMAILLSLASLGTSDKTR